MIVDKELVNKVKEYFDLNIYQTKAWVALLSKSIASASEISEISGIPRSRTYDVLESLEKQGFAIEKLGKKTKYIAVRPETVLEKLKRNSYKEAEERVKILDSLKDKEEFDKLNELHQNSLVTEDNKEISGTVKGDDIYSHFKEIASNANKEILICMSAQEALDKNRMLSNIFEKVSKNGGNKSKDDNEDSGKGEDIEIKMVLNGDDEMLREVENKYNIKPKKTNLNSKFFLIDRNKILFNLNSPEDEGDETAVILNSDFFSNAFASMFEKSLEK